jgi:hypothetical protein
MKDMKKKAISLSLPLLSFSLSYSLSPFIAYYLPKYQSCSVFVERKSEKRHNKEGI